MMSISRFLEETLKVKVNTQKSTICKVKEGSVLGFEIHRKKGWAPPSNYREEDTKVQN